MEGEGEEGVEGVEGEEEVGVGEGGWKRKP